MLSFFSDLTQILIEVVRKSPLDPFLIEFQLFSKRMEKPIAGVLHELESSKKWI